MKIKAKCLQKNQNGIYCKFFSIQIACVNNKLRN